MCKKDLKAKFTASDSSDINNQYMDIVLVSPVSHPLNFREGISEAKTVKFVRPISHSEHIYSEGQPQCHLIC